MTKRTLNSKEIYCSKNGNHLREKKKKKTSFLASQKKESILRLLIFALFFCVSNPVIAERNISSLKIEGFVDTGLTFSLDKASGEKKFSFHLNEVEIALQHKLVEGANFRVAINYLKVLNDLNGLSLLDGLIQEAWLRYEVKLGKSQWKFFGLMGKFFAPQGWDAVNGNQRYQASISFANQWTPNTFTGAQLGVFNNHFAFGLIVSNGWDLIEDIDQMPSIAFFSNIHFGAVGVLFSVIHGTEPSAISTEKAITKGNRVTMADLQLNLEYMKGKLVVGLEGNI